MLRDCGPDGMLLAGGTDLLPNMKRRQQVPKTVISLRDVTALKEATNGSGMQLGAGRTLTELVRDARVLEHYPALWQAAAQVATPHLRNMGTLGGNLCLDTRCTYYDQNYEWRKAIDFCMKKDGKTCWVAPSSKKCLAVSSTDTAPALIALGAKITLVSQDGERMLELADLYQNDGIHYATRKPDELLTKVTLDPAAGWKSCYWKLRRRGSFDFPVLSVAAAVRLSRRRHRRTGKARLGRRRLQPPSRRSRLPALGRQPSSPTTRSPKPPNAPANTPNRWTTPTSSCTGASASRPTSSPTP